MPKQDLPGDYTAYIAGQEDALKALPRFPIRHGIADPHNAQRYTEGYFREMRDQYELYTATRSA